MPKIYTGNEDIDKYLRRNISPNYIIDDNKQYPKQCFLKYLQEVGSKEDIKYVMEDYFGEKRLKKTKSLRAIYAIIELGYCLNHFSKIQNRSIRAKVTKQGHNLNLAIHDQNLEIRLTVAAQGHAPHILIHDHSIAVRQVVARTGHELDFLANDPNEHVRFEVLLQSYQPEHFKNDPSVKIRYYLAKKGLFLEDYVYDPHPQIREIVAENGVGLEHLIHDKYNTVRLKVAEQGYKPEILIHDENSWIRKVAQEQLKTALIFLTSILFLTACSFNDAAQLIEPQSNTKQTSSDDSLVDKINHKQKYIVIKKTNDSPLSRNDPQALIEEQGNFMDSKGYELKQQNITFNRYGDFENIILTFKYKGQ